MWPSKLSFPWIFTPHNSSALMLIFSILFTRKWRRLTEIDFNSGSPIYSNITLAVFIEFLISSFFTIHSSFGKKPRHFYFIMSFLKYFCKVFFSQYMKNQKCLHCVSHPCFLFFIMHFLIFIFPLLIILHTCRNWRENNTEGFHCIPATCNCEIIL